MVLPAIVTGARVVTKAAAKNSARRKRRSVPGRRYNEPSTYGFSENYPFEDPRFSTTDSKQWENQRDVLPEDSSESNIIRFPIERVRGSAQTEEEKQKRGIRYKITRAAKTIRAAIKAAPKVGRSLYYQGILYLGQVVFALVVLIGLNLASFGESFAFGILDYLGISSTAGLFLYYLGSIMIMFVCIVSFMLAVLALRKSALITALSIPFLAICFGMYLIPYFNFLPWMPGWTIYMCVKQVNSA